jgi:hypothetical protein
MGCLGLARNPEFLFTDFGLLAVNELMEDVA